MTPSLAAKATAKAAPDGRNAPGRFGLALVLVALVRIYQWLLSPLLAALGARCRFSPSCSEYAVESLRRHGALRGGARATRRLLRCHPGHPGGVDLP